MFLSNAPKENNLAIYLRLISVSNKALFKDRSFLKLSLGICPKTL